MNLLNNRLLKTELVDWKTLVPFQPDNLKKTEPHKLQKLANSLCENGFSMNFYVWEKDGQIYIIDGHSRQEVLQLLESGAIYPKDPNGKEYQVTIPDKFPCSFLHLKNKAEAKSTKELYTKIEYKTPKGFVKETYNGGWIKAEFTQPKKTSNPPYRLPIQRLTLEESRKLDVGSVKLEKVKLKGLRK